MIDKNKFENLDEISYDNETIIYDDGEHYITAEITDDTVLNLYYNDSLEEYFENLGYDFTEKSDIENEIYDNVGIIDFTQSICKVLEENNVVNDVKKIYKKPADFVYDVLELINDIDDLEDRDSMIEEIDDRFEYTDKYDLMKEFINDDKLFSLLPKFKDIYNDAYTFDYSYIDSVLKSLTWDNIDELFNDNIEMMALRAYFGDDIFDDTVSIELIEQYDDRLVETDNFDDADYIVSGNFKYPLNLEQINDDLNSIGVYLVLYDNNDELIDSITVFIPEYYSDDDIITAVEDDFDGEL